MVDKQKADMLKQKADIQAKANQVVPEDAVGSLETGKNIPQEMKGMAEDAAETASENKKSIKEHLMAIHDNNVKAMKAQPELIALIPIGFFFIIALLVMAGLAASTDCGCTELDASEECMLDSGSSGDDTERRLGYYAY